MELGGFLRLTITGGSPRRNPLSHLVWRGQGRASQTGMLIAATLFVCALTFFGKIHLRVRGELLLYLFLRWGLAEFFWVWMSADHLFSTVMRWKRRRAFDELRLTRLSPTEMAVGFLGPSLAFLLLGNTIHSLVDGLTPYGRGPGLRSSPLLFANAWDDVLIWRIALSLGFWFSAFATAAAASAWSFRVAMESGPKRIHANWFATLVRACLMLGAINGLSLLAGALVASILALAVQVAGMDLATYEATLIGIALVVATGLAGILKLMTIARREWAEGVTQVETYQEPEAGREEGRAAAGADEAGADTRM